MVVSLCLICPVANLPALGKVSCRADYTGFTAYIITKNFTKLQCNSPLHFLKYPLHIISFLSVIGAAILSIGTDLLSLLMPSPSILQLP